MPLTAITGAASGIGAATRLALSAAGHAVIGVDVRDADVIADLSNPDGRAAAVDAVLTRCGGKLDHLVLCAGLGPHVEPASRVLGVNYFGAVQLLDALLPALSAGHHPSAVVVSSVASAHLDWDRNPLAAALEAGDESAVQAVLQGAGERAGQLAYAASKNALTVAARRRVAAWGAVGVRLNCVAPGAVETPLLQAGLADPRYGQAIERFTAPIPRRAHPGEIAAVISFLLGPQASYVHGAQFFVDGGVDAAARPTRF
jgi:NAD(P)-dependent dehydrogenase (short-subunit alcohol dehydrogenase family)